MSSSESTSESNGRRGKWTFLSNHGHIIIIVGMNPEMTIREIAVRVGITERAVLRIITELEAEGFIEVKKRGRQNVYQVNRSKYLRHPIEDKVKVIEVIDFVRSKSV